MDEHELPRWLWHGSDEVPARTRFCPDDEALVAYFEGALGSAEREQLGQHLVGCTYCEAALGNLGRLEQPAASTEISGPSLASARQLATGRVPRRLGSVPAWATAAVLLLAIGVLSLNQWPNGVEEIPSSVPGPESRQVRNLDPGSTTPAILAPSAGSLVTPAELEVRWSAVPGTLHYDVTVVDHAGFIVWQGRSKTTQLTPPLADVLQAGERYYVRVDAYLAESNTATSDHVLFSVQGQQE